MFRTRSEAALIPLLLAACAHQGSAADPDRGLGSSAAAASEVDVPFVSYRLDNGLKVILHQDDRLPLVAVSVWYDVGALHEKEGRSGFAHLFEHMMFQGSPHVGEDRHFAILEEVGGSQINGTTSFDRTNYFETVPSNALETALWLESDRMGFLLESVTRESLDNQIAVVKNERRQSVESRPYGLMDELITQRLYPKPHPYHGNVIGSLEDIGAATLADVRDFFQTYYTPANATLVLAGDFEMDQARALVEKYFGPLEGRPKPARPEVAPPKLEREEIIEFEEPAARLPKLSVVWPGPRAFSEDAAALDILAHVLSGTRSSRLDRKVSFEDPLAQSVTAYFQEFLAGGQFQIDLVAQPGRTLDQALAAVDAVLADLRANPPTDEEILRAKNAQETRTLFGLERLGGFGGRAEQLQTYNHYLGDPSRLRWDLERYRSVTRSDLERVMKTWLGQARLVVKAVPSGRAPRAGRQTSSAAFGTEGRRKTS